MQLSTIFVLYGQFDPTKKIDETDNYEITAARVNTDAIVRYDSNNAKTIYAPWISSANGAAARRVATIYGRRFGIVPRECSFALEDKDSSLWVGDVIDVSHPDISDFNGNNLLTTFEILQSAEGDTYTYQALEYNYDAELANDEVLGVETFDYNKNENNVNLLNDFTTQYGAPDSSTVARFIVYSGVIIGSASNTTYSIQTGSWPSGAKVTIQVNSGSYIVGYGGNGSSAEASAGQAGGPAINLSFDVEIINNGTVGGGGGGGGADEGGGYRAGGGGGAGQTIGNYGSDDTTGIGNFVSLDPPENGSVTNGGSGGSLRYDVGGEPNNLVGGDGGDLGEAGGNGGFAGGGSGGTGGAAGKGANLNGNVITLSGNAIQGTVS